MSPCMSESGSGLSSRSQEDEQGQEEQPRPARVFTTPRSQRSAAQAAFGRLFSPFQILNDSSEESSPEESARRVTFAAGELPEPVQLLPEERGAESTDTGLEDQAESQPQVQPAESEDTAEEEEETIDPSPQEQAATRLQRLAAQYLRRTRAQAARRRLIAEMEAAQAEAAAAIAAATFTSTPHTEPLNLNTKHGALLFKNGSEKLDVTYDGKGESLNPFLANPHL